jgi:hypothetical protein
MGLVGSPSGFGKRLDYQMVSFLENDPYTYKRLKDLLNLGKVSQNPLHKQ